MSNQLFRLFVGVTCLVAAVSCATAPVRRQAPLNQAPLAGASQGALATSDAAKAAAQQAKLHYVEIGPSLKGDYKFGYDTGSGAAGQSFREETRLDDGTVKGAYGYVDANGKQRIVKYTAGKMGFVVEDDKEAPGQGGAPAAAPVQERPRPQPVQAPQPQRESSVNFDEPTQFQRQIPQQQQQQQQPQLTAAQAEAQHAAGLRQHQLAQQAALAEQQRVAQQQQLQQQALLAQQQRFAQQQAPQRQQQQQQQDFGFQQQQPQQQVPQFAPQPPAHQTIDPQTGSFFASSNDGNLQQLLQNQLRALQGQQQQQPQFAQPQAQQFAPQQQAPAFQSQQFGGQQLAQQSNAPVDFNHQLRARQVQNFGQQPQQAQATPQSALLALHQQQQHDAQILANLRAQQLAQLQQQQRAQQQQPQQFAPAPQQQQFAAPQPQQQQQFAQPQPQQFQPQPQEIARASSNAAATSSAVAAPAQQQPETFGPPVIDIRTLNYSIGQQMRNWRGIISHRYP